MKNDLLARAQTGKLVEGVIKLVCIIFIFISYYFNKYILGHNARKCHLPSDTMLLTEEAKSSKKKKGPISLYPKCNLLARLGVDYLAQFAKQYNMEIDFTFQRDEGGVIFEVIEKIFVDGNRTDSILTSIAFYLLSIRDQSDYLRTSTSDVLAKLLEICNLPSDLQWVCLNNIFKYYFF
jgi:hypothetical protein